VRSELAVPPKCDEALLAGSAGPGEAAGISPFQLKAGRKMAEDEGRDYVPPGVTAGFRRA
jgi:hypothetical protein